MPEIDDMLPARDITDAAAGAAEPPGFAGIARRGERRRTRHRAAVLGSFVGVVLVVVAVGQLAVTQQGGAPQPAGPTPSETMTTDSAPRPVDPPTDPAAIVEDADAHAIELAAQRDDPGGRAVVWVRNARTVVAITDDDFSTRRLLAVPAGSSVYAAGGGRYVLAEAWNGRRLRIVDANRVDREVDVDTTASPVAPGEIPVVVGSTTDAVRVLAVDAVSGSAHPVPLPVVDRVVEVQAHSGRLAFLSIPDDADNLRSTYHWSEDGGATWAFEPLDDHGFSSIVPGPAGSPHFVIEGADGATLFPFVAVHEMAPAGGGFARWEYDAARFTSVNWALTWGEEMRVHLSVGGRGQETAFRSFSSGTLDDLATDLPDVIDKERLSSRYGLVGRDWGEGAGAVWIADFEGPVYRSTDGGETWAEVPAR